MTGKTDGTNTWTYTWDDDNRLTRVQGPGSVDVTYQYDSLGRMLNRTSGGVTTRFIWSGWNCAKEVTGTIGVAGNVVMRWYCPPGELFSFERTTDEGTGSEASTFYQVHSDALGSVRAITDSSGAVVGSYTYAAWGETLSASHPSGFTMPYLFCGGWGVRFEPSTGLHFFRNRWYDSQLARFLSRDPVPSINLYSYCYNDPVNYIDPTGEEPNCECPSPEKLWQDYLDYIRSGDPYSVDPFPNKLPHHQSGPSVGPPAPGTQGEDGPGGGAGGGVYGVAALVAALAALGAVGSQRIAGVIGAIKQAYRAQQVTRRVELAFRCSSIWRDCKARAASLPPFGPGAPCLRDDAERLCNAIYTACLIYAYEGKPLPIPDEFFKWLTSTTRSGPPRVPLPDLR